MIILIEFENHQFKKPGECESIASRKNKKPKDKKKNKELNYQFSKRGYCNTSHCRQLRIYKAITGFI